MFESRWNYAFIMLMFQEKLRLSMVQELARIQCSSKLKREEKGPLGAAMILYYQKDDVSGTLVRLHY